MKPILFLLIIPPIAITVLEIIFSIRVFRSRKFSRFLLFLDFSGFFFAFFGLGFALEDIVTPNADWYVQIYENHLHVFLSTEHRLSVLILSGIGYLCYLFLSVAPIRKIPPLIRVLALSGTYMGTVLGLLILIQLLSVYPESPYNTRLWPSAVLFWEIPWILMIGLCILLIAARTTVFLVRESGDLLVSENNSQKEAFPSEKLPRIRRFVLKSGHWPFIAAFLMFPVTGILSMILMLFGQSPAAVIRAFTETADWTFSTKIPPQFLSYDEHYLCTVAAGGHRKLVKPLRMGVRHGHSVVVNRQLQVANAFEQILEERTPKFHRAVRNFYDKYGFPLARLIRTKLAADIVYVLMKPLEWLFLAVLYLCDVHPEDRICIQYTGKKKEDLL